MLDILQGLTSRQDTHVGQGGFRDRNDLGAVDKGLAAVSQDSHFGHHFLKLRDHELLVVY